ncbi:MAG: AAA domain-containing protein, partial [Planctomycetaceae bacterium]|nr:AAA domain-containing protein [Planctomycetaceae bacterium]
QGRTVDFTNTIIVMTSNVGSQIIQKVYDENGNTDEMKASVQEAVRARFAPEFLNRIDEQIIFEPLGREQIGSIVNIQIKRLERRVADQGFDLFVSDEARKAISDEGYDPVYGARPLKRVIQNRIENPLASYLLKGDYPEGSIINIDFQVDSFVIEILDPEKKPLSVG